MNRPSRLDRLRGAYQTGGLSGVARTLDEYIRWRLGGSPVETTEPLESRLDRTDASVVVVLMRDYFSKVPQDSDLLVSIILPTRDRPERLQKAVESVSGQAFPRWELIIVNDSDEPFAIDLNDPRIRVVQGESRGVAAARNRGLDTAKGNLIAFLDDDNLMDPFWLNALAHTLDKSPEAEVLIGAQIVTPDPGEMHRHFLRFPESFDWYQLTKANFIDMGMLAHRPRSDLRFDESLPSLVDWDYAVRLTIDTKPVLVPAVAGLYLTDSPGRISYTDRQDLVAEMHRRFATMRPTDSTLAELILGHHDVGAIKTMLGRLRAELGRDPEVHFAGTGGHLVDSVATTVIEGRLGTPRATRFVDVLFTEEFPSATTLGLVRSGGLVVGLNAPQIDYTLTGLPHSRPVGDHLWIGSRTEFNPEDLFEGATLVKFGIRREG